MTSITIHSRWIYIALFFVGLIFSAVHSPGAANAQAGKFFAGEISTGLGAN